MGRSNGRGVCLAGVKDDEEEWWDQLATHFGKPLWCHFVLAAQCFQ